MAEATRSAWPDTVRMAISRAAAPADRNSVKNAPDASRDHTAPKVALPCAAAGDQVIITVRDNGEGVAADRLETIFVPFYTSRSGGSGIGLSLARQIAQAHGGQLTARNNDDGGATFEMSLPRTA